MGKMVTLTIDGKEVSVPAGTLIVDAGKKIGIDIPVFCYHPKMEPVGMCRMCLVDVGRPVIDRASGQVQKNEDGSVKVQFGPKLETACTTPVADGMVVRGMTEKVQAARKEMIEFLLTSHPLDCPICDKGGECPLQNLTMAYGPGQSRFLLEEKMRLAKHLPLGNLIYLDRERCIQCARCIRFQNEIAGDPVIDFYARGRALEIVTYSEPGFDSYFSGNTTDICPVGALTTADFRFEARPWEMNTAASICPHCPVGCNITMNVRRETRAGGETVIKRVMPRQNESVNEIWICDKGRFGYHFAQSDKRVTQPLVRQGSELVPATWEEALDRVAGQLREAQAGLVTLAGGRLANEDLFNLRQVTAAQGGQALLYESMAGGDLVAKYGPGEGTNLLDVGKGSAILVVASDLENEAPVWYLRIRQAARRGALLIVANPRATKLDQAAAHCLRYTYGGEGEIVSALTPGSNAGQSASAEVKAAVEALAGLDNLLVVFGHEGTGLAASQALAQACAALLAATGHFGKPNNGLMAAWPHANTQGAWDMGFHPETGLAGRLSQASAVLIAAADPAGDDPALAEALRSAGFVAVQELFLTETAKLADVVLPAQPFSEREGSYTNGERRVQRFYPGVPPRSQARADFTIAAQIGLRLGLTLEGRSAAAVMRQVAQSVPDYAGVTYDRLAEVTEQWPDVGRHDLYYGGTTYNNYQGLGVRLSPDGRTAELPVVPEVTPVEAENPAGLTAVPIDRLYDLGTTLQPSTFLLEDRLTRAMVSLHPEEAARLGLTPGQPARVNLNGLTVTAQVVVDEHVPAGVVLVPRSTGIPIDRPMPVQVEAGIESRE